MSAEVRDDDNGPVDREAVITNLLLHRLEEFVGQPINDRNMRVIKANLEQSLRTMAKVFRIQRKMPIFDLSPVMAAQWNDKNTIVLTMLHPDTSQPMTVQDWLDGK